MCPGLTLSLLSMEQGLKYCLHGDRESVRAVGLAGNADRQQVAPLAVDGESMWKATCGDAKSSPYFIKLFMSQSWYIRRRSIRLSPKRWLFIDKVTFTKSFSWLAVKILFFPSCFTISFPPLCASTWRRRLLHGTLNCLAMVLSLPPSKTAVLSLWVVAPS